MRNSLKTVLFISALSPALVTMALVRMLSSGADVVACQLLIAGSLGTSLAFLIAALVNRVGEKLPFDAKKVESNDMLLLGFVGGYLVPVAAKALDLSFGVLVSLLVTIALSLWYVSSIPAHPVLRVFGYRFYKVESANGVVYTLLARRDIHDSKSIKFVKKISESMLMEGN